jgi:prepilin-type N-terminal cleavage/methylation domain-containing protein
MSRRHRLDGGFTIVEMLVVIGVLALLMAILVPALSGAQKKGRKLRELSALRQIATAWDLYSNANTDKVLPGYLERDVQARWKVSFEYPDHEHVPPAPGYGPADPNLAGPWTWRLMPYLDYNQEMVHGHVDDPERDRLNMSLPAVALAIAEQPGFGYNAFYVGGWWEMVGASLARYRFCDATVAGLPRVVVSTSIGTIQRSSDLVIFCSSSILPRGVYRRWPDTLPGAHYVVPPTLADDPQWSVPGASGGPGPIAGAGIGAQASAPTVTAGNYDPTSLEVLARDGAAAPIGRYNRLIALLFADGHTGNETPGALRDMRRWIDTASVPDFQHN